jgi:probable DNA metabolism protein
MQSVVLKHQVDFEGWRLAARALALGDVPPEHVVWSVEEAADLFAEPAALPQSAGQFSVPRALVTLAETVIQAREPARFGLLYALVWRAHRGEKRILGDAADPLVQRLTRLAASIRRDTHKMRAFLRFREVPTADGLRYAAWFEPDHYIVEANAGFFVRRFATMHWSILTPYRSVHWDGESVRLGDGASKSAMPDDDALETYWRAYFASIFNPARLKIRAMTSEMPKKYWQNLPEAAAIPELIRMARERTETMVAAPVISPERPKRPVAAAQPAAPGSLAEEAAACRRCDLWRHATQTVFGEGPTDARIMLIGEQPGDQEDLAGRPFVGPAGKMLNQALQEAKIDRSDVYITNAVKHFKFEPRGKRRIHATPDRTEIEICRFWLDREREILSPSVTILLGASAARAVLGRSVTISRERGRPFRLQKGMGLVTIHPSYLLRLPDQSAKETEYHAFVRDLSATLGLLEAKSS